jgi:addiction module RelB/DinJ family antitoxin
MKTMINIKADKEVKESAQKVAKDLGLPLSSVINAFLKEFIRNRHISFSAIPRMTPYLESVLGKVEKDIKDKKNMVGPFNTAEEANAYLDTL